MTTYVALLRAVNVAGRNKLPMARLREVCGALGAEEVRTYIQSGNVVFHSPLDAGELRASLEERLAQELGGPVTVILRTEAQLESILRSNPFLADGRPEQELYASFLSAAPESWRVDELDPARGAPDEFRVVGDTIYLHLPTGAGTTKLTNPWFENALGVTATARNWRTVTALVELCGSA